LFCINVILNVKDAADVEKVAGLLARTGGMSREEPGCIRFEVCHSHDNPQVFILCERWESEQAWKDHRERAAVQEIYIPQVLPLVERVPHISTILE